MRLPVASEQWLVRTLLRLGPEAELLDPVEWRELVAAAADRRARPLPAFVERRRASSPVDDAVGGEQVGEHRGRGAGVEQRVVGAVVGDVVPVAQVGQPVRPLTIGIEPARQARACTAVARRGSATPVASGTHAR